MVITTPSEDTLVERQRVLNILRGLQAGGVNDIKIAINAVKLGECVAPVCALCFEDIREDEQPDGVTPPDDTPTADDEDPPPMVRRDNSDTED
ncbi:hypothetical protein LCGC14_2462080 [marine sediment metagenome]|uniref:Uncharacterized protein n=1 Tax=marine sediment metagenome TaxID=412755 RepID=A0A0F9BCZ8_9ZZZZ